MLGIPVLVKYSIRREKRSKCSGKYVWEIHHLPSTSDHKFIFYVNAPRIYRFYIGCPGKGAVKAAR